MAQPCLEKIPLMSRWPNPAHFRAVAMRGQAKAPSRRRTKAVTVDTMSAPAPTSVPARRR